MNCAECDDKECYQGKDCIGIKAEVIYNYQEPDLKIARTSAFIESHYYMKLTRIEELREFAKRTGYAHLGIAFCIGLADEAKILAKILRKGFKVTSVCCKVCGIEKKRFNLKKINAKRQEAMCNPIGQAMILNREKTDLNIIVGLCIGHDILFTKHSEAPVTTLIVKDRVLGHNPVAALYSGYYRKRL
jgi:uncharacterized metal-binding protein